MAKASSGKEEKVKDEEEGEEEEEEEDDEGKLEEWLEQVREIENAMAESANEKLPDAYVIKLMKSFLASNICLNQGYVLDGYPKTMEQVKNATCYRDFDVNTRAVVMNCNVLTFSITS